MERNVGFVDAIKMGFANYVNFSGRSQRAEYWWWTLFTFLGGLVLGLVDGALGLIGFGTALVFQLAIFLPSLAVAWRRMHDIDKSGWWNFLAIVPIVIAAFVFGAASGVGGSAGILGVVGIIAALAAVAAAIYVLILLVRDSDRDTNRFGPSPKYGSQAEVFN